MEELAAAWKVIDLKSSKIESVFLIWRQEEMLSVKMHSVLILNYKLLCQYGNTAEGKKCLIMKVSLQHKVPAVSSSENYTTLAPSEVYSGLMPEVAT